jgi:hypothetical protein
VDIAAGSPFVPSGMVHGDLLYLVNDMQSILTVFDAKTGPLAYQDRLGEPVKEGFSSSPWLLATSSSSRTTMAGRLWSKRAGLQTAADQRYGRRVIASPALVDGVWYWRTDRELVAIQ